LLARIYELAAVYRLFTVFRLSPKQLSKFQTGRATIQIDGVLLTDQLQRAACYGLPFRVIYQEPLAHGTFVKVCRSVCPFEFRQPFFAVL